ncbi:hypothetical protein ACJMK2_025070, partial [Sinanodonta woodiana]
EERENIEGICDIYRRIRVECNHSLQHPSQHKWCFKARRYQARLSSEDTELPDAKDIMQ